MTEDQERRGEQGGALLASVMQAFDHLSFCVHQHNSAGRYTGYLILAHAELRYVSPLFCGRITDATFHHCKGECAC